MQFVEQSHWGTADGCAAASHMTACTFDQSTFDDAAMRCAIAERLRDHGFAIIRLCEDPTVMTQWENLFRAAFEALPAKEGPQEEPTTAATGALGPSLYRAEHGATLGYRDDDTRQFFETRQTFDNQVDPSMSALVPGYDSCALQLFQLLGAIGRQVVSSMAELLDLDGDYFTDLMDGPSVPESEHFSSAVLRVCSYQPGNKHTTATNASQPDIAFGSHTDTSFVTIAPVSSNNGLEVMDLHDGSWHMVEVGASSYSVVVFTGECAQMLTKSYYRAAVHRVRVMGSNNRISCPLIMRGRRKAQIQLVDEAALQFIPEVKRAFIPDLGGTSMGLIHKMLDFKRQKCRKDNENSETDWILAAYPSTVG